MRLHLGLGLALLVLCAAPVSVGAQTETTGEPAAIDAPIERVTLKNGQIFRGRILERTDTTLRLDLLGAGEMTLLLSKVESVEIDETVELTEDGHLYKRDPNRTRYLYSPSAMQLKKGEGYFSQKELFFSSVAYGLTDHISVLVGSIIPMLIATDGSLNFITAVKVGDTIEEDKLHVAAGFEAFSFENDGELWSAGFLFGSATLGSDRSHVTLSAGKPFSFDADSRDLGPAIVTVSGNVRASSSLSFITENWFLAPDPAEYDDDGNLSSSSREFLFFNSIAARIMGEHLAVDVGMIFTKDVGVPIPWLDFTYNWF
ncbi:MAG: hypothetical protein VX834_07110 [Myxococcota bacterium]|nr:hypothetical protein [Myxococcota bacterium]